jgi:hypothetical protein
MEKLTSRWALGLLLAQLTGGGVATTAGAGSVAPAQGGDARSQWARSLLRERCQPCHIGSSPRALPRALAIFDLDHSEWSQTMSDVQLKNALRRIRGSRASKPDKRRFALFVAEELKRRKLTH